MAATLVLAQTSNDTRKCETSRYEHKHRVFVATDMSNEPDDQMSLVLFLTYVNELDVQGIAGSTSIHKNDSVDEATIRQVISAYGNVTVNLNAHVPESAPYPPAAELLSKVTIGHPVYGLEAFKQNLSDAATAFVDVVDGSDEPTWFLAGGGATILAESLNHVSNSRNQSAAVSFVSKLRVYAISDQDDAGSWLRLHYPQLFYIVSLHAMTDYARPTWNGISGEVFRPADKGGPDSSLITNEWLDKHICNVGELGKHYPYYEFIMEGDTPSFFPLIKSGLGDPEHPEWGNWGGRYKLIDRSGLNSRVYSDATDYAPGVDGEGPSEQPCEHMKVAQSISVRLRGAHAVDAVSGLQRAQPRAHCHRQRPVRRHPAARPQTEQHRCARCERVVGPGQRCAGLRVVTSSRCGAGDEWVQCEDFGQQ